MPDIDKRGTALNLKRESLDRDYGGPRKIEFPLPIWEKRRFDTKTLFNFV